MSGGKRNRKGRNTRNSQKAQAVEERQREEEDMRELHGRLEESKKRLSELKTELGFAQRTVMQSEVENKALQVSVDALEGEKVKFLAELKRQEGLLAELTKAQESWERERDQSSQEIKRLKRCVPPTTVEAAGVKEEEDQRAGKISKLEKDLAEAEELVLRCQAAQRAQKRAVEETKVEGARMLQKYTEAVERRKEAKVTKEEEAKKLLGLQGKALEWNGEGVAIPEAGDGVSPQQGLMAEISLVQATVDGLEKEIKDLDMRIGWMAESGVYVEYVESANRIHELASKVAELRSIGKRYETQIANLEKQLTDEKLMVVSLENVLGARGRGTKERETIIGEETAKLSRRVRRLEGELSEKESTSMIGHLQEQIGQLKISLAGKEEEVGDWKRQQLLYRKVTEEHHLQMVSTRQFATVAATHAVGRSGEDRFAQENLSLKIEIAGLKEELVRRERAASSHSQEVQGGGTDVVPPSPGQPAPAPVSATGGHSTADAIVLDDDEGRASKEQEGQGGSRQQVAAIHNAEAEESGCVRDGVQPRGPSFKVEALQSRVELAEYRRKLQDTVKGKDELESKVGMQGTTIEELKQKLEAVEKERRARESQEKDREAEDIRRRAEMGKLEDRVQKLTLQLEAEEIKSQKLGKDLEAHKAQDAEVVEAVVDDACSGEEKERLEALVDDLKKKLGVEKVKASDAVSARIVVEGERDLVVKERDSLKKELEDALEEHKEWLELVRQEGAEREKELAAARKTQGEKAMAPGEKAKMAKKIAKLENELGDLMTDLAELELKKKMLYTISQKGINSLAELIGPLDARRVVFNRSWGSMHKHTRKATPKRPEKKVLSRLTKDTVGKLFSHKKWQIGRYERESRKETFSLQPVFPSARWVGKLLSKRGHGITVERRSALERAVSRTSHENGGRKRKAGRMKEEDESVHESDLSESEHSASEDENAEE